MGKVDYAKEMELQRLLKENTTLKNKLQNSAEKELTLKEKIGKLENNITNEQNDNFIEKVHINDLFSGRNVRDDYHFEEIDELSKSIESVGQLQPATITNNNIILIGHRRYRAVKSLFESGKGDGYLSVIRLKESYNDIPEELYDKIQFAENDKRKSLDNFQISKLFNSYLEKGYKQNDVANLFDKSKFFVSSVLTLKSIDMSLISLLKEIQFYGMSKKKLHACNFSENDRKPSIIGINNLTKIARCENILDQKEVFLALFKSKISDEEIELLSSKDKTSKVKQIKISKFTNKLKSDFDILKNNYTDEKSLKIISQAEEILNKLNNTLDKLDK